MDLAGDGLEHFWLGDPALKVLAVGGEHGQPVAAVEHQLAQRLGEGLAGEQRLGVLLVSNRPGKNPLASVMGCLSRAVRAS